MFKKGLSKSKIVASFILLFILSEALHSQTISEQPIITVLDFISEDVSRSEVRLVVSMISTSIYRLARFKVIDISQRDNMMKELSFSLSSCSDESCQLELGRMLAAELIVVGHIGTLGTRYVLSAKILDTASGATFGAEDGIYSDIDSMVDDLDRFVQTLSSDLVAQLDKSYGKPEALVKEPPGVEDGAEEVSRDDQVAEEEVAVAAPPTALEKEKPEKPPREPREPREREAFRAGTAATLAFAGGAAVSLVGGLDLINATWPLTGMVRLAEDTYRSAVSGFDDAYLGYLAESAFRKETAAWGIGLTAGGAVLAGSGFFLGESGTADSDFSWRNFFLTSGGAVSLLSGVRLLTEAGGHLSAGVERTSAAYIAAEDNFDALYDEYLLAKSLRSSAFWKGLTLSAAGLGSLGTGVFLHLRDDGDAACFHWPGFLLLTGGVVSLWQSVGLLAEAGGPLSIRVDTAEAIYLNAPEDYDAAYASYQLEHDKRAFIAGSGLGLGIAGLGLTGVGVWQYFFTPPPDSCENWSGWLLTGSGAASMAWGCGELLAAALYLTPEVKAAAAAYAEGTEDFDLLYETYTAAKALRNAAAVRGAVLVGTGLVTGALGVAGLVKNDEIRGLEGPQVGLMVLPRSEGFSVMVHIRT